jgi:hypothetical protein
MSSPLLSQPPHPWSSDPQLEPPQIDPSNAVPAIILSVSSLPHPLISYLHKTLGSSGSTLILERDFIQTPLIEEEGDIILSPNRCIILCTLAQITQSLPSVVSSRINTLANKYRQIEVIVRTVGVKQVAATAGMAEFCGWLETVRRDRGCGIRVVFVRDDEVGKMERWIGFLGLNREVDGEDFSTCLKVEESAVKTLSALLSISISSSPFLGSYFCFTHRYALLAFRRRC